MSRTNEEILFNIWSDGWNREMPVTLIRYDDNSLDLHCQTGDHHIKAIRQARKLLKNRALKIAKGERMLGPTGIYYPIERI